MYLLDPDYLYLIPEEEDPIHAEKSLLASVLERAIADAMRVVGKIGASETPQAVSREALKWIMRKQKTKLEPFSFEWICENLNLEPKALRKAVLRAREARAVYIRNDMYGRKNAHLKQYKRGYAA